MNNSISQFLPASAQLIRILGVRCDRIQKLKIMQLKFYAVFGSLLFFVVFEDYTVGGQQQENAKVDSKVVGHRRLPRSLFLVKTAAVVGAIGVIAGLIIGHKKSRKRNHIQAWGHRHYGKRSIGDDNQTGSVSSKYDDTELLRAAKILDQLGCGGRLLCELHQQKKEDLNETGRKIVQLFDEKQQPPTIEQLKTDSKAVLHYAVFVGANVPKELKVCSHLFPKCPITTQAIADAFSNSNAIKSVENNNSSVSVMISR